MSETVIRVIVVSLAFAIMVGVMGLASYGWYQDYGPIGGTILAACGAVTVVFWTLAMGVGTR